MARKKTTVETSAKTDETNKTPGKPKKATKAKSCRKCDRWQEVKQRMRVAEFIAQTVTSMEERLEKAELKPSVAEYLKLLQLEQEWEEQETLTDEPKEILVSWVEPVELNVAK